MISKLWLAEVPISEGNSVAEATRKPRGDHADLLAPASWARNGGVIHLACRLALSGEPQRYLSPETAREITRGDDRFTVQSR